MEYGNLFKIVVIKNNLKPVSKDQKSGGRSRGPVKALYYKFISGRPYQL